MIWQFNIVCGIIMINHILCERICQHYFVQRHAGKLLFALLIGIFFVQIPERASALSISVTDASGSAKIPAEHWEQQDSIFTFEPGIPTIYAVNGICNRTSVVRNAIMRLISSVNNCANVTKSHLGAITGVLNLGYRRISSLQPGDFDGLTSLTVLDLSSASLEFLPDAIFQDLGSLKILYLWGNSFEVLPAGVFDGLTQMNWLYLDHNELNTLPDEIFDGLTSLTTLDLSENKLNSLPVGVFDDLIELESLDLSRNDFKSLSDGIFDDLTSLKTLYLWGNSLNMLPSGIFDELGSLEHLGIWDNTLTSLSDGLFDELSMLRWLGLWNNSLRMLPGGIFDQLTALETLLLGDNSFSSFPDGIFNRMTSLRILGLWGNSIDILSDGIFDGLNSLTVLGLHDNMIRMLPDGIFKDLSSLPLSTFYSDGSYYDYPGLSLQENPGAPFKSIVDAGTDQSAEPGSRVSFTGTSMGPWGDLIRWKWTQVDGLGSNQPVPLADSIELTGSDTSAPGFTAPMVSRDYYFRADVTPSNAGMPVKVWGHTNSDPDWVRVRVETATARMDSPEVVDFELKGNYPNPFKLFTVILIDVPGASVISVDVFNMLGQRVHQADFPNLEAGFSRSLPLDLSILPSGAYVYRITAQTESGIQVARGHMTRIK